MYDYNECRANAAIEWLPRNHTGRSMSDLDEILDRHQAGILESGKLVHVYPLFGPKHVCTEFDCWCHPEPSLDDARVIVHNVMH